MRKLALVLLFTGLVALTTGSALANTLWDMNADFSIANGNPNGVWNYGWVNGSTFQPYVTSRNIFNVPPEITGFGWYGFLSSDGAPCIWENTSQVAWCYVQPGEIALHPGPSGQASVARWTAPADCSGNADIQGQFLPGDGGIMQVGIFKNGIWDAALWHASDSGVFDFSIPIVPGDTIEFGVYGGYGGGSTPLEATITTVPEPSTIALLGMGVIGLIGWAWRRRKA